MIHPDMEKHSYGTVFLDSAGLCEVCLYDELKDRPPHFHIIAIDEDIDFEAVITGKGIEVHTEDNPDELPENERLVVLKFICSLEDDLIDKGYMPSETRIPKPKKKGVITELESNFHRIYFEDMTFYERLIWDSIPHCLYSKHMDIDGKHCVLYPNALNSVMQGIDDNMFEKFGVRVNNIMVQPYFATPEQETTRQAFVFILTDDIENAENAIKELHSLMFMLGETYAFTRWQKLCSMFESPLLEDDDERDSMFNTLFENNDFQPRESLAKELDTDGGDSFIAFSGKL